MIESEYEAVFEAIPHGGYVFVGWQGLCEKSIAPCYLHVPESLAAIDENYTLKALFRRESKILAEQCQTRKKVVFVSAKGSADGTGSECDPVSLESPRVRNAKVIILLDHDGVIFGAARSPIHKNN